MYSGCGLHWMYTTYGKGILNKVEHDVEGLWMLEQDILRWIALNLNNFTISNIYIYRFY